MNGHAPEVDRMKIRSRRSIKIFLTFFTEKLKAKVF
jgi:hypothetical protein